MNPFLKQAQKPAVELKKFIEENSRSTLKYKGDKGVKHLLYVPYVVDHDENGNEIKKTVSMRLGLHRLSSSDGKYAGEVMCMNGLIVNDSEGKPLTDGSCAYCERVKDAVEIKSMRYAAEEKRTNSLARAQGWGETALKKKLSDENSRLNGEMKTSGLVEYNYALVVQFILTKHGDLTVGPDGIPEFSLRVWRLSPFVASEISSQFANVRAEFEGNEIIISYTDTEDKMQLALNRTITPVPNEQKRIVNNEKIMEAINAAVEAFDWSEAERAFPELKGEATQVSRNKMDEAFKVWDQYIEEKKKNPNAVYAEYGILTEVVNPSLGGAVVGQAPALGAPVGQEVGGIQMPNMHGIQMPNIGSIPNGVPAGGIPSMGSPIPDAGAFFQNGGGSNVGNPPAI